MGARQITDLRKLRHVSAVAEAGSFSGAAAVLGITQSALTKSVAEVEHLIGMQLFQRLPRGVRLTEAGTEFLPRARHLLQGAAELAHDMDTLRTLAGGHLCLGVAPAAFMNFVDSPVAAFARVYPGVRIEVQGCTLDEAAQKLLNGDLDVVVGSANYLSAWRELDIQGVTALEHFFIGRRDHPLAGTANVTAAELLRYPVVIPAKGLTTEAQLRDAYHRAGLSPLPARYVCEHFSMVRALVSATDAISPVVSLTTPGSRFLDAFTLFRNIIHIDAQQLGIVTCKHHPPAPPAKAFSELFSAFIRDSGSASG